MNDHRHGGDRRRGWLRGGRRAADRVRVVALVASFIGAGGLLALVAQQAVALGPDQAIHFDYPTADFTAQQVSHFEASWDAQPFLSVGIPTSYVSAPGITTYIIAAPFTSGTHTVAIRACNASGCGLASVPFAFALPSVEPEPEPEPIPLPVPATTPSNVRVGPKVPPVPEPEPEPEPVPEPSSYFDALASRLDCVSAIRPDSQADIDAYPPTSKPYDPVTQKKRPVVYDPDVRAARGDIHFSESNDIQQKYWAADMPAGSSAFFVWDMRYNDAFRYQGLGYIIRHKAFQFNGQNQAPWWTIRSFYTPVPEPYVAEMVITANSQNFVFPGESWRGDRESLEPRQPGAILYLHPLEWGRIAFYFKDLGPTTPYTDVFYPNGNSVAQQWPGGRVMEMSSWMASESRDPILVHDRIKVVQPYASGLKLSKFEVDGVTPWADGTHDYSANPGFGYIWQRHFIQLLNPTDDVSALVRKPVK